MMDQSFMDTNLYIWKLSRNSQHKELNFCSEILQSNKINKNKEQDKWKPSFKLLFKKLLNRSKNLKMKKDNLTLHLIKQFISLKIKLTLWKLNSNWWLVIKKNKKRKWKDNLLLKWSLNRVKGKIKRLKLASIWKSYNQWLENSTKLKNHGKKIEQSLN